MHDSCIPGTKVPGARSLCSLRATSNMQRNLTQLQRRFKSPETRRARSMQANNHHPQTRDTSSFQPFLKQCHSARTVTTVVILNFRDLGVRRYTPDCWIIFRCS